MPVSYMTLYEIEREVILERLELLAWNRTEVAHSLCISVKTLRKRIEEYKQDGFEIPDSPKWRRRAISN